MTGQLLSPSESHAFQSFLSSIDYPDSQVSQEWAMYTPTEHSDNSRARGKEALAKATKDLMSLDVAQDGHIQSQSQSQQQQQFDYSQNQRHHDQLHYEYEFRHDQTSFQHRSSSHNPELFFFKQTSQSRPLSQSQPNNQQQNPHSPHSYNSPRHTLGITVAPSRTISSSASPPPSAPTSYTPPLHLQFSSNQTSSSSSPVHRSSSCSKHSITHEQFARSASHKRPRPSPGESTSPSSSSSLLLPLPRISHPHHQSVSPPLQYSAQHPAHKPTLLSPSQKKANHIQSEQKRRANIRRGYEALCETVPALREAIKEEEVMTAAAASGLGDIRSIGGGSVKGRGKRGRGRGKQEDGEKVDGRAGPRSENVVLSKTIDYINDLLSERAALISRLNRAKDALPPGHSIPGMNGANGAGRPSTVVPLWEREWKGGEGRSDGGEEDEEDYESS